MLIRVTNPLNLPNPLTGIYIRGSLCYVFTIRTLRIGPNHFFSCFLDTPMECSPLSDIRLARRGNEQKGHNSPAFRVELSEIFRSFGTVSSLVCSGVVWAGSSPWLMGIRETLILWKINYASAQRDRPGHRQNRLGSR